MMTLSKSNLSHIEHEAVEFAAVSQDVKNHEYLGLMARVLMTSAFLRGIG